jgi:hypothetical protein
LKIAKNSIGESFRVKVSTYKKKSVENLRKIWTVSRAFIRGLWIALSGWIRIETARKKLRK